ncbi:MAG: DMT family transporter [Lachnospiraceae bacterium]|nr:DMT family transporter [Lachnospiraceae bacterium]
MEKKRSIFQSRRALPFLACAAALSWGFAFPFVKLGMAAFAIDAEFTGGKILFAGIRFTLAGLLVLLMYRGTVRAEERCRPTGSDWRWMLLFAFVNTAAHYFFFYIGLSNSYGSRASVIDSLGTFLLVILAAAVFREKMTIRKICGCALGIGGILLLNIGDLSGGGFTLSGDGMMILCSIFSASGGLLTRVVCKRVNAIFATGISLAAGGLMLIAGGIAMGGYLPAINGKGLAVLACLVAISVTGFSIYNQLLANHPVGKVAIYNSLIPVFGVVLSCVFLNETFEPIYLAAAALVAAGVALVNLVGK